MRRHALDILRGELDGGGLADIAETDHAYHPLALVDDRQPADLQGLHMVDRFREFIVVTAAVDALGHYIARGHLGGVEVAAREALADDVAVRHHPDQMIVLADRDRADIVRLHQPCNFSDWSVGADPVDSLMHHVLDFHEGPPSQLEPPSAAL